MESAVIQSWDALREAIGREFAASPREFLRQPTITTVLNPHQPELASKYCADLRRSAYGRELLRRARDPDCGRPRRYPEAAGCSLAAIQHAWQLAKLWEHLQVAPADLTSISEIGGGYGDMARQMRAAGFGGTYSLYDLPELHTIQQGYLASCGVGAELVSLNSRPLSASGDASLLLATFSVSEMSLQQREVIEPGFDVHRYLMFSWNHSFAGVDNCEWFAGLEERMRSRFQTATAKDPHMRAWYLFGMRR